MNHSISSGTIVMPPIPGSAWVVEKNGCHSILYSVKDSPRFVFLIDLVWINTFISLNLHFLYYQMVRLL